MIPVRWRVFVGGEELAGKAFSGAVHWGRDTVDDQPAGAVASVVVSDPDGTIAAAATVTAPMDLYAVVGGYEFQRFAGSVVDVSVDHAAGETTIVGADELGRLSRTFVGDEPWPQESDGDRVGRILTLAGVDLQAAGPWNAQTGTWQQAPDTWRVARVPNVDGGTVQILARDVDRKPVLGLLHDTANDAAGVVWADQHGIVQYRDALHRPAATERDIPAGMFDTAAVFQRGTGGMVNRLGVKYGEPESVVTVQDDASIATYGMFAWERNTELAVAAEVDSLARQVVAWRRVPRWTTPVLVCDTAHVGDADSLGWLLGAGVGAAFRLVGVGAPNPGGESSAGLVLEGGTDSFTGERLSLTLACSNLRQTAPPVTWAQVPPGDTWASIDQQVQWFDADDLYPPMAEVA